jgi:hypothetical protein
MLSLAQRVQKKPTIPAVGIGSQEQLAAHTALYLQHKAK